MIRLALPVNIPFLLGSPPKPSLPWPWPAVLPEALRRAGAQSSRPQDSDAAFKALGRSLIPKKLFG